MVIFLFPFFIEIVLFSMDSDIPPCCQREIDEQQKQNRTVSLLRQNDRVGAAERRRLDLLRNYSNFSSNNAVGNDGNGGEYQALIEERERIFRLKENMRMNTMGEEDTEEEEEEEATVADDVTQFAVAGNSVYGDTNRSDDEESDEDDLSEYDYLLDEDMGGNDDSPQDGQGVEEMVSLAAFEEQRRVELEFQVILQDVALKHGFGIHRQMHPGQVLGAAGVGAPGRYDCTVLHLYDPLSTASARMDIELEKIAKRYKGTKFMRSGGRSTLLMDANNLASKHLHISGRPLHPEIDIPCLIAIKHGIASNFAPRFQGLVSSSFSLSSNASGDMREDKDVSVDEFALEEWLDRSGVLVRELPKYEDLCAIRPEYEALMFPGGGWANNSIDNTSGRACMNEEYYDCGIEGCSKAFAHKHIGQASETQDGCMLSEADILNL